MNIQLHQQARTTPAIRLELQSQPATVSNRELAQVYNLNRHTVAKWRRRLGVEDASHRPRRLHATLSAAQEAVVVALRETLLLPLDDLLAVTHEFIHPKVSRSALDRCLRRHGVSNLKALQPEEEDAKTPVKTFKDYAPGFVPVAVKSLPQMPDKTTGSTCSPPLIGRPVGFMSSNRIEHRLTKPRTPQTNGLIERFNGRIADVLTTTRFDSSEHLTTTIQRYVKVYNQHIPQKALGHIPPLQALKNWSRKQPNLFKKRVYNLAGPDTPLRFKRFRYGSRLGCAGG